MSLVRKNGCVILLLFIAAYLFGCQSLPKANISAVGVKQEQSYSTGIKAVQTHKNIEWAKGGFSYARSPILSWDCLKQPGIIGYELIVSRIHDFSRIDIQQYLPISSKCGFKLDTGLVDKMTYYWRVRAKSNNKYGPWSKSRMFRTDLASIPSPPKLKNPVSGAQNYPFQPAFEWFGEPLATEYFLEVSEGNSDFSDDKAIVVSEKVSGTLFMPQVRLKPGKIYYWRMSSLNSDTSSGFGEIRKFSTIADMLPPKIKVISDTSFTVERIPAVIEVKVLAVDQGNPAVGVEKVEFYLNRQLSCLSSKVLQDNTCSCVIKGLSAGVNKVMIAAYDIIGNKSETPANITIKFIRKKQGWFQSLFGKK